MSKNNCCFFINDILFVKHIQDISILWIFNIKILLILILYFSNLSLINTIIISVFISVKFKKSYIYVSIVDIFLWSLLSNGSSKFSLGLSLNLLFKVKCSETKRLPNIFDRYLPYIYDFYLIWLFKFEDWFQLNLDDDNNLLYKLCGWQVKMKIIIPSLCLYPIISFTPPIFTFLLYIYASLIWSFVRKILFNPTSLHYLRLYNFQLLNYSSDQNSMLKYISQETELITI